MQGHFGLINHFEAIRNIFSFPQFFYIFKDTYASLHWLSAWVGASMAELLEWNKWTTQPWPGCFFEQ